MGLFLLLERWINQRSSTESKWKLVVCTVDHKLRPESTTEAAQVNSWVKSRGVDHYTVELLWSSKPTSRIQEDARKKRYAALCWLAAYLNIDYLVTAHHSDDQIETFFFRLAHLSGVDGLGCMSPVRKMNGIYLLRPLLSFSKARIIATNRLFRHPWIEDPSNKLQLSSRNRIRQGLKEIIPNVIPRQNVLDLIEDLAAVRRIYDQKVDEFIQNSVIIDLEWGFAMIQLSAYQKLDYSVAYRLLSRLILFVNGKEYTPPQSDLWYAK